MIRIAEKDSCWNKAYGFSCTENIVEIEDFSFSKKPKITQYLHDLKYRNDFSVIPEITAIIRKKYTAKRFLSGGFLISIPPSRERPKQPIEMLAEALAETFNMTYIKDAIPCAVVDTTTPVANNQHAKSRKFNHYYVPDSELLKDIDRKSKIILFDDFYDTGGTMKNVASEMQALGFENINVFTICYTKSAKRRITLNKMLLNTLKLFILQISATEHFFNI